jgi:hypothetical protein
MNALKIELLFFCLATRSLLRHWPARAVVAGLFFGLGVLAHYGGHHGWATGLYIVGCPQGRHEQGGGGQRTS